MSAQRYLTGSPALRRLQKLAAWHRPESSKSCSRATKEGESGGLSVQSAIEVCVPTTLERVHIKKCHWLMAAVTLLVCPARWMQRVARRVIPRPRHRLPRQPRLQLSRQTAVRSPRSATSMDQLSSSPCRERCVVTTRVDQPNNVVAVRVVSVASGGCVLPPARLASRRFRYHHGQSRGEHHDFCWLRLERQLHWP